MPTGNLVLVVDDDPVMREITRIHLEEAGFRVVLAAGAEDGLQKARSLRPALVVMDFAMPGMSGTEAIRSLRADSDTARTPVLMVTAWSSEASEQQAKALGAHWLQKPILGDQLVNAVKELLAA